MSRLPILTQINYLYRAAFRSLTVGVRALLIDEQKRVLLVRHTYCAGWHLPGGGVEVGETLECALRRELKEEAGVELTGPPALHGLYLNISASPRDHVALYVVREFLVPQPKKPDLEIAEVRVFPHDALPIDASSPTRDRIAELLQGRNPSLTWQGAGAGSPRVD